MRAWPRSPGSPSARQAGASEPVRRYRGQALLDVAVVCFQVGTGQHFEQRPLGAGQIAAGFQVVGQASRLVESPGLEGGHELALVDDSVLKCEQSEEQMAVGASGHGEAPAHDVISGVTDRGHGALVARGAS